MSNAAPTASAGAALLDLVKNDALLAFAPPLVTFLQNAQAAAGDPVKISAAFVQLQGDIVGHAPSAIAGLETQLAGSLAAKLTALLASAQAGIAAAAASAGAGASGAAPAAIKV